jgi:tetratricopeptide (TPR) repeat protein
MGGGALKNAAWVLIPWLVTAPLWGAEPMLDANLLESTRAGTAGLLRDGLYVRASQMGEKALKLAEEQYGALHPDLAPLLEDLGTLYRYQARYQEAEQEYDWALALRERTLGPDHPDVAESLRYLASLETDLARYEEARIDYGRALGILEKTFGGDSLECAPTLEALGHLECLMNDGAQAASFLGRCLTLEEKAWGQGDPRLCAALEDMAKACLVQKEEDQAEAFLKRSLDINQSRFTPDSIEVAGSFERLGSFYRTTGREKEALAAYTQAAKTWDRLLFNPDPPEPYLHEGGVVNLALGRLKLAQSYLERSLKLRTQFYGPSHPKVAFALEDLAALDQADGRKSTAAAGLKRARAILEGVLGPDHPAVVKIGKKLEALR